MRVKLLSLLTGVLLICAPVFAQVKTITGRVLNPEGQPVETVTVLAKGTKLGTTTASDGSFSIDVPAGVNTLVFSLVGYSTEQMSVKGKSNISVLLKQSNDKLEEVIVLAYGTVKKSDFVGSAGTVSAKQIKERPIANISRALEGNVPGLIVTSGSGQPGSGSDIRIRGFGSVTASQDPLIVLDGVPYIGGLSNINPDDIENITVLKDASSTALYGSRAGNGVILVSTKKGTKGKNRISLKVLQGASSRGIPEYNRVDQFGYYPVMWEAYRNSLVYRTNGISLDSASRVASGLTSRNGIDALLAYNPFNVARNQLVGVDGKLNSSAQLLYPNDSNWPDFFMKNGSRKEYNLNFNGGADKSDYFVSMGYLKEDGFTKNTDFERYSSRINLNINPLSFLKTGLNISGNYSKGNISNEDAVIANPFSFSRNLGPIYPYWAHNMTTGDYVLDPQGNRIWDLGNFQNEQIGIDNGIRNRPGTSAGRHAPAELELNQNKYRRLVAGLRQYTEFSFARYFKFTANFAFDYQTQDDIGYENQLVGDGAPGGRTDKSLAANQAFTANQLLNFKRSFGIHGVDVLAGHESYNQTINNMRGFKQGQSLTGNTEFGNFTTVNTLTSSTDLYKTESYFGRVNYDYNNLVNISSSIRRDGNSRFAPETRWGTFWSVGAGISLNKLPGISALTWINSLKLRGSRGTIGVADGIGYYAWQGLYGFNNNATEPGISQSQTAFENRGLTWEVNTQSDIGLDFSLFKNRLSGSIEYYNRVSGDLLFAVPTTLSSGALSSIQNTASLYNRGVELGLNGDIVRTNNFRWNMGVNITTIKNQITKMPESVPEFITGTKKYSVGASLYDYWIRSYYGVDSDDGAVLYKAENTTASSGIRFKDKQGGGSDTLTTDVNNAKFEYQGGVIPDFYGSMTQSFTYRGITLSALFTFQNKGLTYDGAYQTLMSSGTYGSAVHADILKRWQKPGDVTDVPRMDNGQTNNFNANSSRWLIDASYFNIRNITLSYALPRSFLSRYKITGATVFFSSENVAFSSKRRGMNNQNAFSGITNSVYPPARVITGGININL